MILVSVFFAFCCVFLLQLESFVCRPAYSWANDAGGKKKKRTKGKQSKRERKAAQQQAELVSMVNE